MIDLDPTGLETGRKSKKVMEGEYVEIGRHILSIGMNHEYIVDKGHLSNLKTIVKKFVDVNSVHCCSCPSFVISRNIVTPC